MKLVYGVKDKPKFGQLIVFALQQLLAILAATICVPAQAGIPGGEVHHASGAASLVGSHAALGYILMGIMAFLLGVCVTVLLYRLHRRNERKQRENWDNEL